MFFLIFCLVWFSRFFHLDLAWRCERHRFLGATSSERSRARLSPLGSPSKISIGFASVVSTTRGDFSFFWLHGRQLEPSHLVYGLSMLSMNRHRCLRSRPSLERGVFFRGGGVTMSLRVAQTWMPASLSGFVAHSRALRHDHHLVSFFPPFSPLPIQVDPALPPPRVREQ